MFCVIVREDKSLGPVYKNLIIHTNFLLIFFFFYSSASCLVFYSSFDFFSFFFCECFWFDYSF